MSAEPIKPEDLPEGVTLREHTYDGIQEYDQRLPNWWLYTLYGAIIFSVFYWMAFFDTGVAQTDQERVDQALEELEARRLAASANFGDEETLWQMAGNPGMVSAGKTAFDVNCAVCHGAGLDWSSTLVGVDLADNQWLYGNKATDLYHIVMEGSPDKTKGMIAWKTQLGPQKVAEVVAYILSHHDREEMSQGEVLIGMPPATARRVPPAAGGAVELAAAGTEGAIR